MTNQVGWSGPPEDNNCQNELFIIPAGDGGAIISGIELWGQGDALVPDPEQYMFLNGDTTIGATDNYYWSGHYRFFKLVTEETEVPVSEDWTVINNPAGSLKVTKTVSGPKVADHGFTFTVTLSDDTLNGTFGDMDFTGGVATFTLKDGEEAEATDLPAGLTYEVSETPRTGYVTPPTVSYSDENKVIVADETAEVDFTNVVETVDIPVKKIWNDANDQDGLRPENIELSLFANGDPVEDQVVTVTPDEEGNWNYTFEGLPKYDADGVEFAYTVEETQVDDYDEPVVSESDEEGVRYEVTNTHTPSKVNIIVHKVWDDNDDQDGVRPESVTVILLRDGEATELTAELSEENLWTHIFEGLDEFENHGQEVVYSVAEVTVDGYKTVIGDPVAVGETTKELEVTNTHDIEKTEIDVTKVWDDAEDQDHLRPKSVTVKLFADGENTGKVLTLSEENEWTGSFENLDVYANGKKITYTVEEEPVRAYEAEISGDAETGFTITNKHTPEPYGSLKIVKTLDRWENASAATFVFDITARIDGKVVYTNVAAFTFTSAGTKEAVFDQIPVGSEVTVTEIYSGSSYKETGSLERMAKIEAFKVASVSFENDYDGRGKHGYGIQNTFTYSGESGEWAWSKE